LLIYINHNNILMDNGSFKTKGWGLF